MSGSSTAGFSSGYRLEVHGHRRDPRRQRGRGPDSSAKPVNTLGRGEVGYLITGVKEIDRIKVGDTLTDAAAPATEALPGYAEPKPMVFSGLFPTDGDDFERLREALEKLRLNDASLVWEPETSRALGFGFRCGFLGLLHMEIVRERLEREYDLDLVATAPSVAYRVTMPDGSGPRDQIATGPARPRRPSEVSPSPMCGR